jgi:hypothetical protein
MSHWFAWMHVCPPHWQVALLVALPFLLTQAAMLKQRSALPVPAFLVSQCSPSSHSGPSVFGSAHKQSAPLALLFSVPPFLWTQRDACKHLLL